MFIENPSDPLIKYVKINDRPARLRLAVWYNTKEYEGRVFKVYYFGAPTLYYAAIIPGVNYLMAIEIADTIEATEQEYKEWVENARLLCSHNQ